MKLAPQMIIFDVDGVLVDVRDTFHRCTIETVRSFTGKRVHRAEIHRWKSRSGYNDDWRLATDWIASLGYAIPYQEVKRKYNEFYWGTNGNGYVRGERWLLSRAALGRLARRVDLALFTGRTRRELAHTLRRFGTRRYFRPIITLDDVRQPKPDPEGLLLILDGRDPRSAIYVGDNVDDAIAAFRAGVPFLGILPHGSSARNVRLQGLRENHAVAVLGHAKELAKWLR